MPELIATLPTAWLVFGLCIARWIGFSLFTPLFGRRHMGAMHRIAICFALALPLMQGTFYNLGYLNLQGGRILLIGIKEVFLGALLGALISIPFWAFRGALTLIDNQRGANAAQISNPSLAADASIIGELGERMLLVWLIEIGAFVIGFEIIAESFTIWPVLHFTPIQNLSNGDWLLTAFAELMKKTILFAAPAIFLLIMLELSLALSSISVKGIDVYQTAMPVKSMAALLLIAIAGYSWFYRGVVGTIDWWLYVKSWINSNF